MKYLVVGKSYYGIFVPIDKNINEGDYIKKDKFTVGCGGFTLTTAKALKNLNAEALVSTVICNDTYGKHIMASLKNDDINTESVEIDYESITPTETIYINTSNNVNTVCLLEQKELLLKKPNFSITPNYIITDGSDLNGANMFYNQYNNAKRILCLNNKNDKADKLIKAAHILILNQDYAEKVSKMQFDYNNNISFAKIYQFLLDTYNKEFVVLLNAGGVLYSTNGQVKIMPALKVPRLNNESSFAAFAGAFVYELSQNIPFEAAIKFANVTSSLASSKYGSYTSVPTFAEVNNIINPNPNVTVNETQNNSENNPKVEANEQNNEQTQSQN